MTATAVVLAAAAHALWPPRGPAPRWPRVVAVAVSVPPPGRRAAATPVVVATYRAPDVPGAAVRLTGLTGPLVAASRVTHRRAGDGGTVFRVSATPDCRRLSAPPAGGYAVGVARTADDGRRTRGVLGSPPAAVGWDAALRQVCWQQRATAGIDVATLRATPDAPRRQLLLEVTLRSRLPQDVAVGVLDIADVARLEASDSGVLPHGGRAVLRVRWPAADCAVPTVPEHTFVATAASAGATVPALEWSVGRPGGDPSALFVTPLAPGPVARVRTALARLCRPPATSITVRAAHPRPPDPVVRDLAGVTLDVRLSIASTARRVVVGTAPTGLTADARVGISAADVRPARSAATAVVAWRARCTSTDPAPPLLPVGLAQHGRLVGYAWSLDAPVLARAYARSCGFTRARLRRAGWR